MRPREYRAGDFARIHLGEQETVELGVLGDEFREVLENHDGPVWSLVEEGNVLGIWGVRIIEGDGHAWAVLSAEARTRPVSLHRSALRCLRESARCVRHLYGVALATSDVSRRWAVRLGFRDIGAVEYKGLSYRRYQWE